MARRGRPPLDPNDKTVQVHVALTARQFDQVYQLATHDRCTMPEVLRRAVRRMLREPEPPAKVT